MLFFSVQTDDFYVIGLEQKKKKHFRFPTVSFPAQNEMLQNHVCEDVMWRVSAEPAEILKLLRISWSKCLDFLLLYS